VKKQTMAEMATNQWRFDADAPGLTLMHRF